MTIRNCVVRNFSLGIIGASSLGPNGLVKALIADTIATNNSTGISLNHVDATLDHVVANLNSVSGIRAGAGADITAIDSVASNNETIGFDTEGGLLRLAHSTATKNRIFGVRGNVISFGDNHIYGNGTNGTVTNVGTQ